MPRAKKPYHHGHLRESLTEAAVHLIAEVGPAGFNLREVARRAGVSHNAPYRHFRDKGHLLAEVAAQGFRELNASMVVGAGGEKTALEKLKRSGHEYVAFALRRPEHFAAMFDAPLSEADREVCQEAGAAAFGTLVNFIALCQQQGELPAGETEFRALQAWSLVHGIAKLGVAKRLPFGSHEQVLRFADAAIDASISALRNPVGKTTG
jgi:AcrR family transcriptional regulator